MDQPESPQILAMREALRQAEEAAERRRLAKLKEREGEASLPELSPEDQAVLEATGSASLVAGAMIGAVGGSLSPTTPFYSDATEDAYPYDPERANELLDEAGWTGRDSEGYRTKDGQRLRAVLPATTDQQPAAFSPVTAT